MKTLPALVLVTRVLAATGHYWPSGYNRHSRGHTWAASSSSSSSRYSPSSRYSASAKHSRSSRQSYQQHLSPPPVPQQQQPQHQSYSAPELPQQQSQQLYSAPQQSSQLYSAPKESPQLYGAPPQEPQGLYSAPQPQQQSLPPARSFSQPRNSVIRRGWSVKGESSPHF